MIGALSAAWLASAQASDQAFDARIRDSAAAAQSLQGPLDGRWLVTDAEGRILYVLQIADAPHAAAPLSAAWTDPRTGALGPVDVIRRTRDGLRLLIAPGAGGPPVRMSLRPAARGAWTGWATFGAARRAVRLSAH